jgi:DNA-binding response OmpR family regulator
MSQKLLRVLLVDDEHDIVQVLKLGLKLNGFEVDGFTDPRQAVEQFQPDYYDAVLVDIRMPGIDGFEVYRRIRQKDANIKIYFLSAFDVYEFHVKEMFPDPSLVEFIRKPINYKVLAQHLMKDFDLK